MDRYNYEHFDEFIAAGGEDRVNAWFREVLHAGDQAPDGELITLDDRAPVCLSRLWAQRGVVLEFGSFT